jgi:hypothetical protein
MQFYRVATDPGARGRFCAIFFNTSISFLREEKKWVR